MFQVLGNRHCTPNQGLCDLGECSRFSLVFQSFFLFCGLLLALKWPTICLAMFFTVFLAIGSAGLHSLSVGGPRDPGTRQGPGPWTRDKGTEPGTRCGAANGNCNIGHHGHHHSCVVEGKWVDLPIYWISDLPD